MKRNFEPQRVDVTELQPDGYCLTSEPRLKVAGALPGEIITAQPFTRRKRQLYARVTEVHEASPERTTPDCSAALTCGGCSLQHMTSAAQLAFKRASLEPLFAEAPPAVWFEPLLGPVSGYRSKARLGVRLVEKKGKVLVGFREKLKPFIAETDACTVLRPEVGHRLAALGELIEQMEQPASIPQIEVAAGDNDIALVVRHLQALSDTETALWQDFGESHDLMIYLQPGDPESVTRLYPDGGADRLRYSLPEFDLAFDFHPLDFTQVNLAVNRDMVSRAIDLLEVNAGDRVLDLFCGIGNFSLAIARRGGIVRGLEGTARSVLRARENATLNAITDADFGVADLYAEDILQADLGKPQKVLLDPPRSGAESVCKLLASGDVERVVYVSCNPATLARDAKILVANGFQFNGAGVIDMFPHTTHVETIACFST